MGGTSILDNKQKSYRPSKFYILVLWTRYEGAGHEF